MLGRANNNNVVKDWGLVGGSMLNLSKSISSPSLKSKLMSVQTHQSSVEKSFFQTRGRAASKKRPH